MSLIIRQLRLKENYSPVDYRDFPEKKLRFIDSTKNLELYSYEAGSNPLKSNDVYQKELYNGSIDDAPIDIFTLTDDGLEKDREKIAEQVYEEYGPGRYNIFIFGGTPPRESVFENIVIREKPGKNKNQSFKAEA